jgi:hypothetical protein
MGTAYISFFSVCGELLWKERMAVECNNHPTYTGQGMISIYLEPFCRYFFSRDSGKMNKILKRFHMPGGRLFCSVYEVFISSEFYAFYAFYAWWIHFPQSGALAEGTSLPTSPKCDQA